MRVEVPGRRRGVEVIGDEAGDVQREEAPREAEHPRVVANVEPDRARDAGEDEGGVRDRAQARRAAATGAPENQSCQVTRSPSMVDAEERELVRREGRRRAPLPGVTPDVLHQAHRVVERGATRPHAGRRPGRASWCAARSRRATMTSDRARRRCPSGTRPRGTRPTRRAARNGSGVRIVQPRPRAPKVAPQARVTRQRAAFAEDEPALHREVP